MAIPGAEMSVAAAPAVPEQVWKEEALGTLASRLGKELLVERPVGSASATVKSHGKYYQVKGFVPKRTLGSMEQEVVKLAKVQKELTTYRSACGSFQKAQEAKLASLWTFNPCDWLTLFYETLDLLIISCCDEPLVSFGTIRSSACRVKLQEKHIDEQCRIFKRATLDALALIKEVRAVEVYELLGKLVRKDKSHLKGLAERLFAAGVYKAAVSAFKELTELDEKNDQVRLQYVAALSAAKLFDEAIKEIQKLHERATDAIKIALEPHRIDALVGLNQLDAAKAALLALEIKTNESTKKLLCLTVKEELAAKRVTIEQSSRIYSQLHPSLVLSGKAEEVAAHFWLSCFVTERMLHEDKKLHDNSFAKLLRVLAKLSLDARYQTVSKAVAELKTEAQKLAAYKNGASFDAISSPLKEALVQAKNSYIQNALTGSVSLYETVGLNKRKEFLLKLVDKAPLVADEKAALIKEISPLLEGIEI